MRRPCLSVVLLVGSVAVLSGWTMAEEVQGASPLPSEEGQPARGNPSWGPVLSSAQLEQAIRELRAPIDQDRLSEIFFGLGHLEDPQEQQRLQELLDQQLQPLTEVPAPEPEATTAPAASLPTSADLTADVSDEELLMRIETLNLGPNATADDLRARDRLVSTIAGIRDPIVRDQLLARLEEKEREWQAVVERP